MSKRKQYRTDNRRECNLKPAWHPTGTMSGAMPITIMRLYQNARRSTKHAEYKRANAKLKTHVTIRIMDGSVGKAYLDPIRLFLNSVKVI